MFVALFLLPVPALRSQIMRDTVLNADIKTVTLYRNGVELEQPVIHMGTSDRLMLQFDLLSAQPATFRYRIVHCNRNWEADSLEPFDYISGFEDGSIDNYRSSFTTLQDYNHYHQLIPAQYTTFTASGNYVLAVYPQEYPDSVVMLRRFMVSEDVVEVEAAVARPTNAADIMRYQELSVALAFKSVATGHQYLHVMAMQNGRVDLLRELPFNGFSGNRLLYRYADANVFAGGNCFRYFDISNMRTTMYNVQRIEQYGGELFAFLKPDESRARSNYAPIQSLNGGMKTNVWDRHDPQVEADYVWVNFSLPLERPFIDGTVHVVGALTDWSLGEQSRMEWKPQYKAYTKRMLLKQGYYSYQLLFLPTGSGEALTATLEGDHAANPNRYTVMVYQRQPSDRYDRLLAVVITGK
ncbi:MAG: DUF5103 domain-containing protein [Bacteroidales bacterium]|nr:DUF5103 domain-containing protein [Bacteroidales bacterium]